MAINFKDVVPSDLVQEFKALAQSKSPLIFVAGTDTDIGKTYIAGGLCKALNSASNTTNSLQVGYFKAAISGSTNLACSDAGFVKDMASLEQNLTTMTPYHFIEPLSPHFAAQRQEQSISFVRIIEGLLQVYRDYKRTVFEGTGGIFCPFGKVEQDWFTAIDIMQFVNKLIPTKVLLVGGSGLGSINHMCCTYQCLRQAGFAAENIVILLNNFDQHNEMHKDNLKMITMLNPCHAVLSVAKNQVADIAFKDIYMLFGK